LNVILKARKLVCNHLIKLLVLYMNNKKIRLKIGVFNVSMLVTNQYGRSLVSPNLYRVSANENLYTFQSYAGI
jgi:hypothetical protein